MEIEDKEAEEVEVEIEDKEAPVEEEEAEEEVEEEDEDEDEDEDKDDKEEKKEEKGGREGEGVPCIGSICKSIWLHKQTIQKLLNIAFSIVHRGQFHVLSGFRMTLIFDKSDRVPQATHAKVLLVLINVQTAHRQMFWMFGADFPS